MKFTNYYIATQPIFDELESKNKVVIFASRTSNIRVIDEEVLNILISERFDLLTEEVFQDFLDVKLIVDDDSELLTILNRHNGAAINDDDLYLVVQPTAYCQLGCHYCGQEHRSKMMSEDDQQRFIERARRKLETKKFKSLSIAWFGAEPLIGLPVMKALTSQLKALVTSFNCSYNAKIVTNGLALTNNVATELVQELGISAIEITLDGVAEYHDARRMQKNGLPTFDKIFANVVNLANRQDLDFDLSIRCNVDYDNYESVPLLLQKLAAAGIQDKITCYMAPIHSWGNDAHQKSLSKEEFASLEINWFVEMLELGFKTNFIPEQKPLVCMAVMPDAELIDAYGNIFNCSEVSYVPTYGTPNEYAIDHLSGKPMPGKRERLGNFNQRVYRGEFDCATCPMLPVCGGACPKSWLEGMAPCPSTKHNIQERLLLAYAVSRLS